MPLAPYAVTAESTVGRRYPEPLHAYRDPFERDRARIIHSRAFRRLEDKTQVFTERANDHFRNRLTHTIEVAQVTRTVAQELQLNVDLAETLALVHDIGHPPFGHAGERMLDELMRGAGEQGFDHNLQALRTVEYVEHRYPAFRGLNLSFEVREGIIKHSRDWNVAQYPELREYRLEDRPPLEAQLIDITDEIAYNAADLDDGVEARMLTVGQIRERVPLFARMYDEVASEFPCVREKVCLLEAIKRMLDYLVGDLIENTAAQLREARIASVEDVRKSHARMAKLSDTAERARSETKEFLYDALYNSTLLRLHKEHGERIIADLFRFWQAEPEALPRTYRQMAGLEPASTDESLMVADSLARVICDYIAGMTDTFCLEQHARFIR
ncbi:MAG: deoxyguanosinetriphosphate triphosphohydrolase [Acidobacteriaceae bacterium]